MGIFHLITGVEHSEERITEVTKEVLPWIDWIHIRMKGVTGREVYQRAKRLIEEGGLPPKKLIINEHVEVALALKCGGVHLPEKSAVSQQVRTLLAEKKMLLGRSVHSITAARQGAAEGLDYLFFGHVFPSPSKPGLPPRGLRKLEQVVQAVDVPVIAIGGIHLKQIQAVKKVGCVGVAVISAIFDQPHPGFMAEAFTKSWVGEKIGGKM